MTRTPICFARRSNRQGLTLSGPSLTTAGRGSLLRAERKDTPRAPVVIMSSSASSRDRAEAEQLGIERYFVKPPDLESFFRLGVVLKDVLLSCRDRESQ